MSVDADDAWGAALHDFDAHAAAEAHFVQAMDVVAAADDLGNFAGYTGGQTIQRNHVVHTGNLDSANFAES
jgi:hypothetical protein